MEPKDLKNSEVELSGAQVEPETVNDQNIAEESVDQTEVIEVEVENAVEEVAEEIVAKPVEPTVQEEVVPEITETEAEPVVEEVVAETAVEAVEEVVAPEVAKVETEEPVAEPVAEVIPSIEELIDVSEDDLLIDDEEHLEENPEKAKLADYANLSEVELINALRTLLENEDFESVRSDIDAIKIYFFRLYRANIEAQKAAFAEAGGNMEEEFKAETRSIRIRSSEPVKTISGQKKRT